MRRPAPVEHAEYPEAPPAAPPAALARREQDARDHQARREELWTKVAAAVARWENPGAAGGPGGVANRAVKDFDAFFGGGS